MQRVDLTIEQGTTWGIEFPLLDSDDQPVQSMAGWSARAQVRPSASDSRVLFEWASDDSADGSAVFADGKLTLLVSAAQSSAWAWRKGVWDLEITVGSGDVVRPVGGRVHVDPEVTR